MPATRKHDVRKRTRIFDDFFRIDEVLVSNQQVNGKTGSEQRRLVFERGDAAAVLLYNSDRNRVVLVRQFRPATLGKGLGKCKGPGDGWVLEVVAGMIPENEYAEVTAVRETMEETGYKIGEERLRPIATYFPSPGGTSEKIFLYYAEVHDADLQGKGGRVNDEDVEVVDVPPNELFEMMNFESTRKEGGTIEDSKLMIAALWLQAQLQWTEREPLGPSTTPVQYRMVQDPNLIVGYLTGPITAVTGIDIWVNSENEDMIMDRFIGRSISANIRHLGARKDRRKNVREDTIANSLKRELGGHLSVKVGTVLETPPGTLEDFGVRRLYHVATVRGKGAGAGVMAACEDLHRCTTNVLVEAEERNQQWWQWWWQWWRWRRKDRSILFPMMGAGDGGLRPEQVAPELTKAAVEFLRSKPTPTLKEIYFLAFTAHHRRACAQALDELCDRGELMPPTANDPSSPSVTGDHKTSAAKGAAP